MSLRVHKNRPGHVRSEARMSLTGVVIGVTGNFDRPMISSAVRRAGGRVDALVHKNLDYVRRRRVFPTCFDVYWHRTSPMQDTFRGDF